jgi:hypothetical protein
MRGFRTCGKFRSNRATAQPRNRATAQPRNKRRDSFLQSRQNFGRQFSIPIQRSHFPAQGSGNSRQQRPCLKQRSDHPAQRSPLPEQWSEPPIQWSGNPKRQSAFPLLGSGLPVQWSSLPKQRSFPKNQRIPLKICGFRQFPPKLPTFNLNS